MVPDGIARVRLSVWCPAQFNRPLDYSVAATDQEDGGSAEGWSFESARLQEEVYYWHPSQEDVWGCIQDKNLASELRDRFVQGFDPSLPPQSRSVPKFAAAVEFMREKLSHDGATSWADAMQIVAIGREDELNLRANSAITLLRHLQWVAQTFGNVPGASVAIR
jgi:hypothetical protein